MMWCHYLFLGVLVGMVMKPMPMLVKCDISGLI